MAPTWNTTAIKIIGEVMRSMCASARNELFTRETITATQETSKADYSTRRAGLINRVYEQWQEYDMNRDRLEGKWKQFSGSVREQWGRLTDNRLRVIAGKHDQLAGRYQEQYGITKEEGERQLSEFLRRNRDWDLSRR